MVDDTVSVIIYNKTTDKLVFVKQFRPGKYCTAPITGKLTKTGNRTVSVIYYDAISRLGCKHNDEIDLVKYPAKLGVALELCTGTVDTGLSLKEIAQGEIEEECGYKIPLDRIEEVMSYRQVSDILPIFKLPVISTCVF